jgi:hypothetical protein
MMIKFVQCVRRKPGLSKQDFREHWGGYGEKVKEIASASKAARCISNTALVVDQNMEIMQSRGTKAPYDGMVELWWQKGADVVAFLQTNVGAEMVEELRAAQEAFMDLPNCTFFFASEDA